MKVCYRHSGLSELDTARKVLLYYEPDVFGLQILLRICELKIEISNQLRHKLRYLHQTDIFADARSGSQTELCRSDMCQYR
jgi:hypothetical protein